MTLRPAPTPDVSADGPAPAEASIGRSVRRKEDGRLVVGAGRYLEDITRPGQVYLGFVRSIHAHARIVRVVRSDALTRPGVVAVLAAQDLPEAARAVPRTRPFRVFRPFERPILATDKTRYVGEAVAVVVATSPYELADALDAVTVEYERLPAVTQATDLGVPPVAKVNDNWPDNVAAINRVTVGDVDGALSGADLVI